MSLTDLAKLVNDDSTRVISKWIEMLKTIDFLERNYVKYDRSGYEEIRGRSGVPSFFLSIDKIENNRYAQDLQKSLKK